MSFGRYTANSTALFSGTLIDENGTAIPIANINSLTLTLIDAMTGLVVNARSLQNVLNSNNVTVNNTTGALNWAIQIQDTTPASAATSYREHVATFICTYETTKNIRVSHRMRIINYLSLCSLEDVDQFIGPGTMDDGDQALVEMFIEQFSCRAENECDRKFLYQANVIEYFSPKDMCNRLALRRYPITSISEVNEEPFGDFANGYVFANDLYGQIPNEGLIKLRYGAFLDGDQSVRVTYSGGLAIDCGGMPMDLRFACIRQVVFWLQRRKQVGLVSVTVARGGKEVMMPDMDLLPDVSRVLNLYRRTY